MIVATVLLAGCPSPAPVRPRTVDDTALRIRIARAEARRGGGTDELVELATHGDVHQRELALRGLGRVGGAQATAVLVTSLGDRDSQVVTAAANAIGVAASLDDPSAADQARLGSALVAASPRVDDQAIVVEALGHAGDAGVQPTIARELASTQATVAEAAGLALGRMGRRRIALAPEISRQLAARALLAGHLDARVRYGAVYALSREFLVASHGPRHPDDRSNDPMPGMDISLVDPTPSVAAALAARITDDDPEIRALAIAGLTKRGAIAAGRKAIEDSLRDRDWRVAVEAVRALAGEHGDDAGRDAVAAALIRRYAELEHGNEAEAHVVIEGLRALQAHGARPLVAAALAALATTSPSPSLAHGWIECLAITAQQRAAAHPDPGVIAGCRLPEHLKLPLLAGLGGDIATRRAVTRILMTHADARVRAAGLGALAATWPDGDHATIVATLASAIGTADPILAGAAVDAAPAIYALAGADATLDAAVVARAGKELEPELSSSLYELIGKRAIAAGADACRAGLAGDPVRARAAAACLEALGEAVAVPAIRPASLPPVDVADVIGRELRWHLVTTHGEIVIALRPDIAPWNVATIVALTRRGFYDGLEFHRVVPGFVVQGGDPTMSGWGGPGFTTPAEPDGNFDAGAVGIADAGRDSGGSQWFVTHARAPHLDGRYTWIGRVIAGQKSADALLIGDRVERATIEQVR